VSRFVNKEATDIITLSNGDKVLVRQKLTAPEQAALEGRLFSLEYKSGSEQAELHSNWHMQKIDICRAYIVSWDFKDDDGNDVAYSPETLDTVDSGTVADIAEAIDKLVTARKEANEKNAISSLPK